MHRVITASFSRINTGNSSTEISYVSNKEQSKAFEFIICSILRTNLS